MKKSAIIPSDILHHDAMNHPIRVGDYALIRQAGRSYGSPFLYGKVSELIVRGYDGRQPGIRFLSCHGERRLVTTTQTVYGILPTKADKSTTIKLDNVVVVNRDTISAHALKLLDGIKDAKESISDALKFVDEL